MTRQKLIEVVLGVAIFFMLDTAIGAVLALTLWPLLTFVVKNANALVAIATFAVNAAAYLATLWCISEGEAFAKRSPGSSLSRIVIANSRFLELAKFVTVVAFVISFFELLWSEASNFVIVQVGNVTQFDFLHGVWAVALGFVAPLLLLILILVLGAGMQQGTE